jgi:hypothetical protein
MDTNKKFEKNSRFFVFIAYTDCFLFTPTHPKAEYEQIYWVELRNFKACHYTMRTPTTYCKEGIIPFYLFFSSVHSLGVLATWDKCSVLRASESPKILGRED